jgi:hypothetical protein
MVNILPKYAKLACIQRDRLNEYGSIFKSFQGLLVAKESFYYSNTFWGLFMPVIISIVGNMEGGV